MDVWNAFGFGVFVGAFVMLVVGAALLKPVLGALSETALRWRYEVHRAPPPPRLPPPSTSPDYLRKGW